MPAQLAYAKKAGKKTQHRCWHSSRVAILVASNCYYIICASRFPVRRSGASTCDDMCFGAGLLGASLCKSQVRWTLAVHYWRLEGGEGWRVAFEAVSGALASMPAVWGCIIRTAVRS